MPRPRKTQQPDLIEQSIRLTPKIEVIIRASPDVWDEIDINWRGKSLSINAGERRATPEFFQQYMNEPAPMGDSPAEAEARRVLEERFPKAAPTPFRTEDVANPLGVELTAENLLAMAGPVD